MTKRAGVLLLNTVIVIVLMLGLRHYCAHPALSTRAAICIPCAGIAFWLMGYKAATPGLGEWSPLNLFARVLAVLASIGIMLELASIAQVAVPGVSPSDETAAILSDFDQFPEKSDEQFSRLKAAMLQKRITLPRGSTTLYLDLLSAPRGATKQTSILIFMLAFGESKTAVASSADKNSSAAKTSTMSWKGLERSFADQMAARFAKLGAKAWCVDAN